VDDVRFDIAAAPHARCADLERALGVPPAAAQVLVRRGLDDPTRARDFLEAADEHDPSAFAGIGAATGLILEHVARRSPIVVHGDYDCDGVCATAILVSVLRELGGEVSWYLPSRSEDGYGLAAATVERLVAEGAGLIVTADCGITAVEEVALARRLGADVVVTDHHQPRADGALPQVPIVHPRAGGYPCPDLCAAGVAHKLAAALLGSAGLDPALARRDLDLLALATIADCVPLTGENRRLVREGLVALSRTQRPGLRALLRVSACDPAAVDEQTVGFRLAPRINAAGRMRRADAGVELLMTGDPERAAAIADELDEANAQRRHVETRILFEAEAMVATAGPQAGYVLASGDWHPGVIGIVASRLAERHHRPFLLIALDGEQGTGSGRSIPGFDLLGALDACAEHLIRHGGHRAAAGCTVAATAIDALRAAFAAHAAAVLGPDQLVPSQRVDAVVSAAETGLELAEQLGRLAPFGIGNPRPVLLMPLARMDGARTMGEGKHVRFTVSCGGGRAGAVAFGRGRLPVGHECGLDAAFTLEVNRWNGAEEPRLVLRGAAAPCPEPVDLRGSDASWLARALGELEAPLEPPPAASVRPGAVYDRRGDGVAATLAGLVASGEPVLVVTACAERRLRAFEGKLGGFALSSWDGLQRGLVRADEFTHVVALDPPLLAGHEQALRAAGDGRSTHLAWGEAELRFAHDVLEHDAASRAALRALYAELRAAPQGLLEDILRGRGRTAVHAGRLVRVLIELGLLEVAGGAESWRLTEASQTQLERSAAFRAYAASLAEGRAWLTRATSQAA
jgi:single-stranded-DNA-specific exonuclease